MPVEPTVSYTTAKVVLVGDSGVGKTGLGWRLSHGVFKEHSSTHGQQFWVVEELGTARSDGTECEAVLWDLAGQPDYRLTHALFLEAVDLAIILFDPGNHSDPLKGVEYWLRALDRRDKNTCPKILVAARADRANPTLTADELRAFCDRHGITGGFVVTSAITGQGLPDLLDRMKSEIAWDAMTATVTTATFKRIKEYALKVKEGEEREVLLDPADLRSRLRAMDPTWSFSLEEMMTAVQHLANHGYLSVLRGTARILLSPEILSNLASSFVLEARRNPSGLGALEESRLLRGDYPFPEVAHLSQNDREILLDAVIALFLEHNLCFRERLGSSTFLIFPSLINQKKPATDEPQTIDDVAYTITGRVENVYAALVVLLGYTNTFTRTNQWQNQAQYEMNPGEICGFRQVTERDGELDLVLYYSPGAGSHVRSLFEGLFETFLHGRDVRLKKYPSVSCPRCGYRPERGEVVKRINEQKESLYCGECGNKLMLPAATTETVPRSEPLGQDKETARRRTAFETALARVKGLLRDRRPQAKGLTCFLSYAWGVEEHERWVLRLAKDLQNADVQVLIDRIDNAAIGSSITTFVNKVDSADFVVVVATPEYLSKYRNQDPRYGSFVAAEMDILNVRLTGTKEAKDSVLPVILAGDKLTSVPPLLRGRVLASFQSEVRYFPSLFDLLLTLYRIPANDQEVSDLRHSILAAE
jgi:small GTP-binding protein